MSAPIAWVTGGGTGIGRALAQQLLAAGYRVAISGRRKEVLSQTASELDPQHHGNVLSLDGDASDAAFVQRAIHQIKQQWGDVDLLINNAGVNTFHTFQQAEPPEYAEIFKINCLSAILCAKAVLPGMQVRGSGVIVNISSILGKWASDRSSAYSVSKYALAGLTDALRQELAGTGIHVMAVYPGFIRTAMTMTQLTPGSLKSRMGASPDSMARAILRGVHRRQREVMYPSYVSWVLRLHRWFPGLLEGFRRRMKD